MQLVTDNAPALILVVSFEHRVRRNLCLVQFLLQSPDCSIPFLSDRSVFHEFLLKLRVSPRQGRRFSFLGCKELGMSSFQCGIRLFKFDMLVTERGNSVAQRPQICLGICLRRRDEAAPGKLKRAHA